MEDAKRLEIINIRKTIIPSAIRLAVIETKETYSGVIVMPQNKVQTHKIGTVVSKGAKVALDVALDDIIIYQVNTMFEASVTHLINETPVMFMHEQDAIGKLTSTEVSLDTFQVQGDYLLLDEVRLKMVGNLYLPDNSLPAPVFKVIQVGNTVKREGGEALLADLEIGDELYIDRSKATPIRLGVRTYYYMAKIWIQGLKKAKVD